MGPQRAHHENRTERRNLARQSPRSLTGAPIRNKTKTVRRAVQHEVATGLSNVKHGHLLEESGANDDERRTPAACIALDPEFVKRVVSHINRIVCAAGFVLYQRGVRTAPRW
jgi:hypothetical protein